MAKFHDLYEAVVASDCARLRQLVRGGADINCRDSMKRTVLHHAARSFWDDGMKDVIRTLVDFGADINAGDIRRATPLHYSLPTHSVVANADDDKASAIPFLILLGADINANFDNKLTSLNRAIQLNNIPVIKTLLKLGVDVNANKGINYTSLQLALDWKRMTLLEHLVKLGADINSSYTSLPPLLQAIELGRLDIVELLVQNGADVNAIRLDNCTSVMPAVEQRIPHVLKILAQLGADLNAKMQSNSSVNEIVKVGRVDMLEYLVRHGAHVFSTELGQVTALKIAVYKDYHEMVDCLLKNGADVNVKYDPIFTPFVTAMRLGDTDMVRALATLVPYPNKNEYFRLANYTTLHQACHKEDPKILELLLKYGGDVNLKCDQDVTLVHEAVALGNGEMLRVFAELGANLNAGKVEGAGLINHIPAAPPGPEKVEREMAFIKMLAEAGADLNQSFNVNVTPLHDAVRLGDLDMVQILGELKVNLIATKSEATLLSQAIRKGSGDIVRYLAENRVDVNRKTTGNVTPLHDAVRKGDVDMVGLLITYGAHKESSKCIETALNLAVHIGNNDIVKCLLECGADINAKSSFQISALHDAVEKSNLRMIDVLADCRLPDSTEPMLDQVTPLGHSIQDDNPDITATLLKYGADMNCFQRTFRTPLDVAMDQGKVECALLLMSRNVKANRDTIGSSPLHFACRIGHIDPARILIIEGSDVRNQDCLGRKPLECLLRNVDYHVLQEAITATQTTEQVRPSSVTTSGCQDMKTSLHAPGIGDVKYISSPSATEISQRICQLLTSAIQQCKAFPTAKLIPVGSSAEGTRVGLPNEMDFLFRVQLAKDEERTTEDLGNGYAFLTGKPKMSQQTTNSPSIRSCDQCTFPKELSGSAGFHNYFIDEVINDVFVHLKDTVSDEKVSIHPRGSIGTKDADRKACSPLKLQWDDKKSCLFIPVDIVPSLHIENWPEGATTRTWLMGEEQLRSRGYVLVPKPPHVKSDLAKECTEKKLRDLWKISFPHLETEHMQRLEQRVKDVYITAKCLKNPDVCRIMITDEGSLPRSVGKYVTSYMLKMCFFQNVEYFREQHMSLEEMVCKVYNDLVLGLSKNFIPIFFLPKVSSLSGIKVDVPKSLKVAKIMARFVRALYLRDSLGDITDGGDDLVMTAYQRNPSSVYRVYDISNEDV